MLKTVIVTTLFAIAIKSFPQNSQLLVEFEGCTGNNGVFISPVSLYKDGQKIDSLSSLVRHSNVYSPRRKFEFKKLKKGIYELRYLDVFSEYRIHTTEVVEGEKKLIKLCYDRLPLEFYLNPSPLTELDDGDTLFIYVKETQNDGPNRGFMVVKQGVLLKWSELHFLSDEYYKNMDYDLMKGFPPVEVKTLSEKQANLIHHFLVEIENYDYKDYSINAPAFYSVFTKTKSVKRIIDDDYDPYWILLNKLTKSPHRPGSCPHEPQDK